MVLVNIIFKTNIFVENAIEVCRIPSSRRSYCGGERQRDESTKRARGWGREYCVFFPTYSTTKKANYWESNKGRPAETINTKVSRKVNLIFYKLNLFPIFLVDKVKKKKKGKIVICRIMMNFTITAAGVTQCKFSINMLNSFNSESRCATSFIS